MKTEIEKSIAIVSTYISRFSGFFYHGYNMLITSYEAVSNFRNVIVRTAQIPAYNAAVIGFDPVYDLAFYKAPLLQQADIGFANTYLPNVGQYLNFFIRKIDGSLMKLTGVVVKYAEQKNIPFFLLKTDFTQKAALGSLVVDHENVPIGMVVKLQHDKLRILPMKHVLESAVDFAEQDEYAFRCPYCKQILTLKDVTLGKCNYCGQILPEFLYKERHYIPAKNEDKIDKIIHLLGYDPFLLRYDKNIWTLTKNGLNYFVLYDEVFSSIVAYTAIGRIPAHLPIEQKSQILNFLTETNSKLKSLTLSLNGDQILLSTIYLSLDARDNHDIVAIFEQLFEKAPELQKELNLITSQD